jgi:ABC-type transporter Mla MlaB component
MTTPTNAPVSCIELHGELVRAQVASQLAAWQSAFRVFLTQSPALSSSQSPLVISLSGVERVDTAGLAVLLHIAREASRNKTEILFKDPPAQLLALAQLSSLTKLLRFV